MAATLITVTAGANLEWGVTTVANVVMQNVKWSTDGNKTVATGEQGDKIGIAIHGFQETEISGDYLYIGQDIGAIGDTLAALATPFGLSGDVVIYGVGMSKGHEVFTTGDFKAVNLDNGSIT